MNGSTASEIVEGGDPILPEVTSKWIKRLLFLGTGTSGQVPALGCLLHKPNSKSKPCVTCHDAVRPDSKNRRGCTSVAIIGKGNNGGESLLLIDCGPTLYTSILRHFSDQNLGRIDGLLLTHAHADAILSLDALRSWTMGGVIQERVNVYCTDECFTTVKAMFPYLVDSSLSTGGGGVGAVNFCIIDAQKTFQVSLFDGSQVEVTPLPVHHGTVNGRPFECLGFRIDSLSYVSDCSHIPASTAELMAGSQVIVLDALNPYRHASHFSLSQALSFALSMPSPTPPLCLLTDLTHHHEHHQTERSLQKWREELQAWRINQEIRGQPIPSIDQVGKGEGGGVRWWNDKWNETKAEQYRRGVDLSLKDTVPSINKIEMNNGKGSLPHFHVAWDGMVVNFR